MNNNWRSFFVFLLKSQEGIESSRQRWFFGGKLLGDKLHVEEAKIPQGYIVQVIINLEMSPSSKPTSWDWIK